MPNTAVKRIHVAVGVILRDEEILLAVRPNDTHMGGLWEFPGGKVDTDETVQQALVRELQEELGITATSFAPLITIQHDYTDKSVYLDVWCINGFSGQARGKEGQKIRWVNKQDLADYEFPAANVAIVNKLLGQV